MTSIERLGESIEVRFPALMPGEKPLPIDDLGRAAENREMVKKNLNSEKYYKRRGRSIKDKK